MPMFTLHVCPTCTPNGEMGRDDANHWWERFTDGELPLRVPETRFSVPVRCSACGAMITSGWSYGWQFIQPKEPPIYVCDEHVRLIVQEPHWICATGMDLQP
jgi:hypothetical protein